MALHTGFLQFGAGLSVGLCGLAAGFAIGIIGDAGGTKFSSISAQDAPPIVLSACDRGFKNGINASRTIWLTIFSPREHPAAALVRGHGPHSHLCRSSGPVWRYCLHLDDHPVHNGRDRMHVLILAIILRRERKSPARSCLHDSQYKSMHCNEEKGICSFYRRRPITTPAATQSSLQSPFVTVVVLCDEWLVYPLDGQVAAQYTVLVSSISDRFVREHTTPKPPVNLVPQPESLASFH